MRSSKRKKKKIINFKMVDKQNYGKGKIKYCFAATYTFEFRKRLFRTSFLWAFKVRKESATFEPMSQQFRYHEIQTYCPFLMFSLYRVT